MYKAINFRSFLYNDTILLFIVLYFSLILQHEHQIMKKLFIFLLINFSIALFAQNIQLQWKGSQSIETSYKGTREIPNVENFTTDLSQGTLYLNFSRPLANAEATQLVWEEILATQIYSLDDGALPTKEIAESVSKIDSETQKPITQFLISAFKRENNKIYRLKSFSLSERKSSAGNFSAAYNNLAYVTTDNPLASGNFYKIKVDKSGVFKITSKFLRDIGINPSSVDPRNLKIYGNGGVMLPEFNQDYRYPALQENAIEVIGEEDGKWDEADYALFYAQGPDGFNLYKSGIGYTDNKRTETRLDYSFNLKNIYEDFAYYFITFDKGAGKRIQKSDIAPPPNLITTYDDYQFINEEKNNLVGVGRVWVGDLINGNRTITFTTNSPIPANSNVYVNARVAGYNANSTSVEIDINGNTDSSSIPGNGTAFSLRKFNKILSNITGNTIQITLTPNLAGNPSGAYYFDYAEAVYEQPLHFNGTQMNFRKYDISSDILYGFKIGNISNLDEVWNVSDLTNAKSLINKGTSNEFIFGYQNNTQLSNEFVAFNRNALYEPEFVERIQNQDLSSLSGVDYLMITRDDMVSQAQRLAAYYTQTKNYNVAVVTDKQIYNEFSSGGQDITGIRDFITYLKKRGPLKYVLILGDASYDYKNRIENNDNIIPIYESEESGDFESSFATDDYYGITNPQNSHLIQLNFPDVPVGRLPASNVTEAKLLIDKTLAYYNALPGQSTPFGDWRMNMAFVVDDDNTGGVPFHNDMNDALEDVFNPNTTDKPEYHIRKLYLDAYPPETTAAGQRYPQVTEGIKSTMNNGLYLYYFGHGGVNGWSQKRVLTQNDILSFENYNNAFSRFPLVSTITCEFTLWDDPKIVSAGELLLKLKTGGAASMITSNRALSVSYGRLFTETFTENILALNAENNFDTLGDAYLKAKKAYGANSNHLRVSFLGDPAMTLSRPQKLISNVSIKNKESSATTDIQNFQVKALDFITITGNITTDGVTINENFNGKITVVIFDKLIDKKTRNNNGRLTPILSYKEEGNPIVRTTGNVTNGQFTIQFYVPKDINYDLGEGRILLYADNWKQANDDSFDVYYNSKIKVGDLNENGIDDDTPPKVHLYMNNINFVDGGITHQNPTFLACITDDTGINSTGSGVGHDITAVLDGKVVDTYVLNEFFSSGEGNGCTDADLEDYQKGSVSFPFSDLEPGPHQLVFKVWDINNNSTTETLNFIVKDNTDEKLTIKKLLNWPNPFTNKTYIQFEHNCSDILEVNTQIYTITGKLVKTLHTIVSAEPFREGFRTPRTAIEWDGLDDYGDAVGKGTYIFKVMVKGQNNEICKGSATLVEKMVLLK